MKSKKMTTKLILNKKTLANLSLKEMEEARGGKTKRTYCNQYTCKITCTETGIPYCH